VGSHPDGRLSPTGIYPSCVKRARDKRYNVSFFNNTPGNEVMGFGMAFAHMRNRKPTQKCKRCGLRYKFNEENCPHCHGLNEVELNQLLQRIKKEHRGNVELGKRLLFAAVIGMAFVLLIALIA
jgi:ribosomal protein L37E